MFTVTFIEGRDPLYNLFDCYYRNESINSQLLHITELNEYAAALGATHYKVDKLGVVVRKYRVKGVADV